VPRTGLVALVAVVVALGAGAFLALRDAGGVPDVPPLVLPAEAADPFAYSEKRRQDFERRAAQGLAHVLYEKSPGGIVASARRTARWRPLVEGVASEARLDADLIEAIVLLESAGRPDAVADPELEGAVGLTQILAGTGQGLLRMRVDVAASRRLTRRIQRVRGRGELRKAKRLEGLRRRVDHRFDPRLALEGTARYLDFAQGELGRDDLAVVSYHMGVGNLTGVIEDFGEGERPSYAQLFFESSPSSHGAAWRRLAELGDDSSTYYWRVLAAREIMRAYATPWPARTSCRPPRTPPRRCCTRATRPSATRRRTISRTLTETTSCAPSPRRRAAPDCAATGRWASWPAGSTWAATYTAGCGRRPTRWRCTWPA
jgi:hypothetical protein